MSNQPVTIIGFDPSLRNWGYCIATYADDKLTFHQGGVIHSKPNTKQKQNLQDLLSATQLYRQLKQLMTTHKPDYIVAELPVGSQSSRAMVSYATCISLCSVLAFNDGIKTHPLINIPPQEVKKTVGKKNATKDEVIQWVAENYPDTKDWLDNLPKSKKEHICDAIVATHTAIY